MVPVNANVVPGLVLELFFSLMLLSVVVFVLPNSWTVSKNVIQVLGLEIGSDDFRSNLTGCTMLSKSWLCLPKLNLLKKGSKNVVHLRFS